MKTKDSFKEKVVLVDVTNMVDTNDSISWRGNKFLKFTLQLGIVGMDVKIYATNIISPKSGEWIDMTDYFVSADKITADTILLQTTDTCVLWWKIVWTKTAAVNAFRADLYQYGSPDD